MGLLVPVSVVRADVRGRWPGAQYSTGVQVGQGANGTVWGRDAPPPPKGTLTPFIPLSLRAFNGEGERRTEAYACAMHMRMPLVQYWGERKGMDSG